MNVGQLGCGCAQNTGAQKMFQGLVRMGGDYLPITFGGLGQDTDDLSTGDFLGTSDIDIPDIGSSTIDVSATPLNADISPLAATSSIPTVNDTVSTTASGGGNLLSSLLTGLGVGAASAAVSVVGGAISTAALQQTNAQRMAQGLPPLTANGQVMTQAQMIAAGYSQAQVSAFSSQLPMDSTTLLILAAVGLGAFFLIASKK